MRAFFTVLRWTLLSFGGLLVLVLLGAALFTQTTRFRDWAREQLITTVNDMVRGQVSIGRLEGSIWGSLVLHDVELRYRDETIARVPRLRLAYSLLPLLQGRMRIGRLEASQPWLRLAQDDSEEWNVIAALSPRDEPDTDPDSGLAVLVRALAVTQGELEVHPAGVGPAGYLLKGVNIEGSADVVPPNTTVKLRRLTAQLVAPELPELSLEGALVYRDTETAGTLEISDLHLAAGVSQARLDGSLALGQVTDVTARLAIERLSPADVARVVAGWPIKRDLAGTVTVQGPLSALAVDLDLAAAGAKILAELELDVTDDEPRFHGMVDLAGFNVATLLEQANIAGVVDAKLKTRGAGFVLGSMEAEGRVAVRSTRVSGWDLGDVSVDGQLRNRVANISGAVKSALGGASLDGRILLREEPVYDFAMTVNNLDISKTIGNGHGLKGNLNFAGTVKGSGIDPAKLTAQADLRIQPSTVGPVQIQQGVLAAKVANGRVRLEQASLRTPETTLTVRGEVALDPRQQGRLEYQVRSTDIAPWLALIEEDGSGTVELDGRAMGNFADLRSSGTLKASRLRFGDTSVESGTIDFDLRRQEDQPLPQGTMRLRLTAISAAVTLQRLDGAVRLSSRDPYQIAVDLTARDRTDRVHRLLGRLDYRPESLAAHFERVALELPDGTWELAHPAVVRRHELGYDIEQLVLRNKAQQISVSGRFAIAGQQDLAVIVEGFPVGGLAAFIEDSPDISGILALRARIGGTAAAPLIEASAKLASASIAGQQYGGAVADLTYKDRSAALKLTVFQDPQRTLTAAGTIPIALSWSPEWQAEPFGNMNVRIQSAGLSLAFLNAFTPDVVQNVSGDVTLDLLVQGPISKPVVRGPLQLSNGAATAKPLGISITAVTLTANFDGQTVSVRELSARSGDGRLSGNGVVILKDYRPENFKINLTANRWPAIRTQRYQAVVGGKLQASGPMDAPALTGALEVLSAELRPDLAFLDRGRDLARDPTIVVIRRDKVGKPVLEAAKKNTQPENGLWEALRLDVSVALPNQIWIRRPDANVELGGKINVVKEPGREVRLTGTVRAIRGWVAFQGRRFEIARATVQFTGAEKFDALIDIAAVYRLPQYQVEVRVDGSLDKPRLELRSEPQLEQADILAVLLFGKPIEGLTQSEQVSLQQSAVNIASGFAANVVSSAVTEALGLDRLGLDLGEFEFGGGRIGFGRYIGDKTYISISQDLAGEHGQRIAIEYQIGANWKITTSNTIESGAGIGILWHRRY